MQMQVQLQMQTQMQSQMQMQNVYSKQRLRIAEVLCYQLTGSAAQQCNIRMLLSHLHTTCTCWHASCC